MFTGNIKDYTRDGIKKLAESHGIIPVDSISRNVDLVVCGENPGKSKISKAEKLWIKIIDFNEFSREIWVNQITLD